MTPHRNIRHVLFALSLACQAGAAAHAQPSGYEQVVIAGEAAASGIGDPSVEYGADGTGWMSYTAVDGELTHTHLARSDDRGKTWTFVEAVNQAAPGANGYWNHEMSTLAYDPTDPGREWKLFWNRYFDRKDRKPQAHREYSNGWFAYRYSADPAKGWSAEIPLFVMGPFAASNPHATAIDPRTLHPTLKPYVYFSEAGSLVRNGVIYLSMDASVERTGFGSWGRHKIILLKSADHTKTWQYAGTLTNGFNAAQFGYLIFTGSSLLEEGGQLFLSVSPSGSLKPPSKGHDGVMVFDVVDLDRAALKKRGLGKLVVRKRMLPIHRSGGQIDYHEQNTYGGIVLPQINLGAAPQVFQAYSTRERIAR